MIGHCAQRARGYADDAGRTEVPIDVGPIVDGDLVAGRWSGQGESSDGPLSFIGNDILRVQDGRIVEFWVASSVGG